ncbi:ankyrin repeat domain-containing protein [Pseudonocardiaceae bacterium YIM PH 21723]|nr:ankyrin repeat domain-containing protein [Pseudonocardiaceae bacterium YIM PH 21723]
MPTRRLPDKPDLEQLRKQAKNLLSRVRAGNTEALALTDEFFHGYVDRTKFKLAEAQLALARSYGFTSWARAKEHIDLVHEYTRTPFLAEIGGPVGTRDQRVAEFLRLACLVYRADDPQRWADAATLLATDPEMVEQDIFIACAAGNVPAVHRMLGEDPELVRATGGPHDWPPLLYACYSRLPNPGYTESTLECAALLLRHGADPNSGYLWDGLTSPFTALTGALGGGEDRTNQPPHQFGQQLAMVLLAAGADPNDSQALYNRQFDRDDSHLHLLFEAGLGTGDGGPWHRRFAVTHPSPQRMLADQLNWAAERDMPARVALLLKNGVPPSLRAMELAVGNGNTAVVDRLLAAGGIPVQLDPALGLVADVLAGREVQPDEDTVRLAVQVRPDAVAVAAGLNRPAAIRRFAELGFDVDHSTGRTALHQAAYEEHLDAIRVLLELGADPTIADDEFGATPLGWAEHAGREEAQRILASTGRKSG